MPSDLILKSMNMIHHVILKVSGSRIGWTALNMPVLSLTTVGRKSGQSRTVMLTSPARVGTAFVVVASRGGDDHHPAWFLNLRANPDVTVSVQGDPPQPMRARVADEAERAKLWPGIAAEHENYAGYQRKTDREIPLVLLEPRTD